MVRTEVTLPDGSTVDLTKPENHAWRDTRESGGTVSTVFVVEDLATDAVVIRTEHEPGMTADFSSKEFAEEVREGRVVPIEEEDLPESLR